MVRGKPMTSTARLTGFERLIALFTRVQPGEGRCIAALWLQACVLMVAYYLIRPVREALILTQGGAELRSYAVGVQALLLLAIIPAYGALTRLVDSRRVFQYVNAFFALNLFVLCLLGHAGCRLGFVFFIWASIFGVMAVTQFWAFATDLLNVASGERLFGVLAIGLSCGAWIGSRLSAAGMPAIGPYGLMLASGATLIGTIAISNWARRCVPAASRNLSPTHEARPQRNADTTTRWLGGFALIGRSRYLLCIAALVVLLNWITSTGEYVLADWLVEVARQSAPDGQAIFIGRFMGNYSAAITLVGFLVQLLLVSRVILIAGVARALLIAPMMFLGGYLLIGIFPVFALLQAVLVAQRSMDYSLLNTTRNALLLPTSWEVKYEAKTTIDTFFYRLGDLMSTLSVFAGARIFHDPRTQILWLTLILSATLTLVAWLIGREYRRSFAPGREDSAGLALPGGAGAGVALQQ
jgi:AAA family ATP:ADP antiporter